MRDDTNGAVNLTSAILSLADLSGSSTSSMKDLTGVDFEKADLTGADLSNTTMTGAILNGAKLTSAVNASGKHYCCQLDRGGSDQC